MAERRMFAKSIVLSDAFLDMPMSTRCLYFTLGMLADDDGFIGSPKSIMRQCGASQDDMKILLEKRYVLSWDSGVIVIKHWRMNNYLRNDRYNETTYLEEKETLAIDAKGAYTEAFKPGIPDGNQVVYQRYTQDRIGKDRLDKDIDNMSVSDIVDYLNQKTGAHYKASSDKTKKLIKARLNEGFSVDDFKVVIDKKVAEWKSDSKMSQYLRPETLFGTKFEGYLNQKAVKPGGSSNQFNSFDGKQEYDFEALEKLMGG